MVSFRMTLTDLVTVKYSVTPSVARPLSDSWASCHMRYTALKLSILLMQCCATRIYVTVLEW